MSGKMMDHAGGMEQALPGEVGLTSEGYTLMRAWESLLRDTFGNNAPFLFAPALIDHETLERTGYLSNFPQNVMRVEGDGGAPTDKRRYLTPASCLHIYPRYEGRDLEAGERYAVLGRCGRNESGKYSHPYRLSTFHMLEFVTLDNAAEVVASRDDAKKRIASLFEGLGISGHFEEATDPFFAGESKGAYLIQKMKALKHEYVVETPEGSASLASTNLHEEHFTGEYSIRRGGVSASSLCIAFGLERLVAYTGSRWGFDSTHWPDTIQHYATTC